MSPHGTASRYVNGPCRCDLCREARRVYEQRRRRLKAYGRTNFVDAEPVRQHVKALQASGLGWMRIAALAGVNRSVVDKLLYGDQRRGVSPTKRMRPETARKILAVRPGLESLGSVAGVDGTGTRRRLEALIARGWSQSSLARQLGMFPGNFGRTLRSEAVYASTARAVRELYERLWDTPPPESTRFEKGSVARARAYAQRNGFAPPLAWDEETIDDPDATPAVAEPERPKLRDVISEEYPHLSMFMSDERIALKLGIKVSTLKKHLGELRKVAA